METRLVCPVLGDAMGWLSARMLPGIGPDLGDEGGRTTVLKGPAFILLSGYRNGIPYTSSFLFLFLSARLIKKSSTLSKKG